MHHDRTIEFRNLLAGKISLRSQIKELRYAYKTAKPFPHLIIDDLFSEGLLDSLLSEISEMHPEQWLNMGLDTRERTARMRSAAEMSTAGNQLTSIIHSAGFLYLLSEITGVTQLLPDPYLQGAGYALMQRGDYFSVHADRNVAYDTGLTRRLAMIVFLNKSWSPEYRGQLELWSSDAKRCEISIEPLFNKTVIFEVAYPNFHGVPAPLECPNDRQRQSFITYYHTAGVKMPGERKPHTSIFAPRFYGTNRATLRSFLRDMTPPLLSRIIRRLGKKA
jgi:Rps23 Pro-64 3,4-dihydroxylase Tpa1-like proline 4-hydroxylase